QVVGIRQLQGEAAAVKLEEPPATFRVRQRVLDRLIDASRARGERRLDVVRPVGGQQEDYLGVRLETVHLVEQLVQGNLVGGMPRLVALGGNQVYVLHDHQRGRQHARHLAALLDQPE